jgi:acetolactate synthase regulatory subunit
MLTLKTKFAALTAAASIMTLAAMDVQADSYKNRAWAERNNDRGQTRSLIRQQPTNRFGADVTLRRKLSRTYRFDLISLRRLMGINSDYRGYRVAAVTVTTKRHSKRVRLSLVVNGQRVDSKRLSDGRVVFLTPNHKDVIGNEIRTMELAVRGRAFIKDIKVQLKKPARRRHWRNGTRFPRGYRHEPVVIRTPNHVTNNPLFVFARILRNLPAN